jgi:hypothetical protein
MSALLAPNGAATASTSGLKSVRATSPRTPRLLLPVPPERPARPSAPATPGSRAYRRAVAAFDTTSRLRPALAGTATSVEEVVDALATARREGLAVRMHSTGHGAGAQAAMDDAMLLRVRIGGPVTIDRSRGLVRIPAGSAWGAVVPELAPHGLAVAHGSSAHVGVVGYLTRGGLSAYGRSTGVAANTLESVEIVLADGRVVVADAENESELFWAVRGGGGGFGVVTAVTVRAFEPGEVVTGAAFWRLDDAPAVADAWDAWTRNAPANITTSLRVMSMLPVPGVPLRLAGRRFLVLSGTAVDSGPATGTGVRAIDVAAELIGRVRAVAEPVLDTWQPAGVEEVPHTHMDPPVGAPHVGDHMLLDDLATFGDAEDPTAGTAGLSPVSTWLDAALTGPGRTLAVQELRQLGGALAQAPAHGGAVASLAGRFGYFAVGARLPWRGDEANRASLDELRAALSPWDTGRTAPTFAGDRSRPQRSFGASSAARAAAVRTTVDPDGLFAGDVALGALVSHA